MMSTLETSGAVIAGLVHELARFEHCELLLLGRVVIRTKSIVQDFEDKKEHQVEEICETFECWVFRLLHVYQTFRVM
jgi:hypothetical protein